LAHAVGKVEAAYRRGDLLEKRRLLSPAWAGFRLGLTSPSVSKVIPIPKSRSHTPNNQQARSIFSNQGIRSSITACVGALTIGSNSPWPAPEEVRQRGSDQNRDDAFADIEEAFGRRLRCSKHAGST
jgi:hypothetical protein